MVNIGYDNVDRLKVRGISFTSLSSAPDISAGRDLVFARNSGKGIDANTRFALIANSYESEIRDQSYRKHTVINNKASSPGSTYVKKLPPSVGTGFGNTSLFFNYSAKTNLMIPQDYEDFIYESDFSLEAYVYFNTLPSGSGVASEQMIWSDWGGATSFYWAAIHDSGDIKLRIGTLSDASYADSSPITVTTGVWYHLAVARYGYLISHYLDEALVGSPIDITGKHLYKPDSEFILVGARDTGLTGYFLDANIDCLMFSNIARSTGALYTKPSIPLGSAEVYMRDHYDYTRRIG